MSERQSTGADPPRSFGDNGNAPPSRLAEQFNNLPPHNLDAEMSVLASMMIEAGCVPLIRKMLTPDAFFADDNRIIYAALIRLADAETPFDTVTLVDELARWDQLESVGGKAYIGQILSSVPDASRALPYAKIVHRCWTARRGIAVANTIIAHARAGDLPAEAIRDAVAGLDAAAHPIGHNGDASPATDSSGAPAPVLVCMADVEARKVDYIWRGRIPRGRITLLVGRPGEGKSFLTFYMAATVSTGSPWPDGSPCERGNVLLLSAEDDAGDTLRPRLDAMGADCGRITILKGIGFRDDTGMARERGFTLADIGHLEESLKKIGPSFVVIDPIGSYLGGKTDGNSDSEVRSVLAPVAALAERYNCTIVIVAHRRKSAGASADDLALGSRAFTGIARAVWHLSSDQESRARRLLLPGKMNLSAQPTGLAFSIIGDPPVIAWEKEPVTMHADDALALESSKPGPEPEARNAAMDWLRAELADMEEHAVSALKQLAKVAGHKWPTVERAKASMRVISHRGTFGGGYVWRLPKPAGNAPDGHDVHGEPANLMNKAQNSQKRDICPSSSPCPSSSILPDEQAEQGLSAAAAPIRPAQGEGMGTPSPAGPIPKGL